jgi:hypothetical protein
MKLPCITKIRIPILVALAIGEIVGLFHFYGLPDFVQFVILSLEGIFLTFPLLWADLLLRRGVDGFNIFIALLSGASIILMSQLTFRTGNTGDKIDSIGIVGVIFFMATVILFKMLRPHYGPITRYTLTFFGYIILFAWACSSHISMQWKIAVALPLSWFAWRTNFNIRKWRLNRKLNRNLSRIKFLNSGARTSAACKRLSSGTILGFMATFLGLLLLMVLRYWCVGDRISSIALSVAFLYIGVNFILRYLRRKQPSREVKKFKDHHMYKIIVMSAIHAAIFGFVAIRGWHRDGSLFWSGLCWAVALIDVCLSTFMGVVYFRFRKNTATISTQLTQSS